MGEIIEYSLEYIVFYKSKDPILNGEIWSMSFGSELDLAERKYDEMKKDGYENLELCQKVITTTVIDYTDYK